MIVASLPLVPPPSRSVVKTLPLEEGNYRLKGALISVFSTLDTTDGNYHTFGPKYACTSLRCYVPCKIFVSTRENDECVIRINRLKDQWYIGILLRSAMER